MANPAQFPVATSCAFRPSAAPRSSGSLVARRGRRRCSRSAQRDLTRTLSATERWGKGRPAPRGAASATVDASFSSSAPCAVVQATVGLFGEGGDIPRVVSRNGVGDHAESSARHRRILREIDAGVGVRPSGALDGARRLGHTGRVSRSRRWVMWVPVVTLVIAVLTCLGAGAVVVVPTVTDRVADLSGPEVDLPRGTTADDVRAFAEDSSVRDIDPPGLGIRALALPLGLLSTLLLLMALPSLVANRVNSVINVVFSVLAGLGSVIGGVLLLLAALAELILMLTLFLSAPFGTLAYLAVYGSFDVRTSALVLASCCSSSSWGPGSSC